MDYPIKDNRHSARNPGSGLILGQSVEQAKRLASRESTAALGAGRQGPVPTDQALAREMQTQRQRHARIASSYGGGAGGGMGSGGGGTGSMSFATQRPRDPFFYWQQNNLPYDFDKPEHLQALRMICRHVYKTHTVMASAIDVYSQWPLLGMEFTSKDKDITEFYTDLFFDQLDYEEFLPDLGREFWTVGEAFPLGSFNESLGIWEDDELLNPDDVLVQKSPFVRDPHMFMRLPESLRKVLQSGQPRHEYEALMRSYPELRHFAHDQAKMPVSNILLKHLKFKADPHATRGLPILYRALRPLMQEEMLNAAQESISDRLSTPLILAKLGASATDLGTNDPWVPTPEQIGAFESSLDAALAADFRVMTTHFAVDMSSVFGKETMPNFDADFERLTEKQLQAFGLSKTMLSGAGSGETYAADAINRDLISQLLTRFQRYIRRFVNDRMLVVAEAQEHWDYEVRGGKRYPIMEEVLVVDEESGERRVVEQPKLLVPDLNLANMNMKDDETERNFLEALRAGGVPISMKRRLVNVDIDLEEEREAVVEEQVELAVEAQRTRKITYEKLRDERLPIPQDLVDDFAPKAMVADEPQDQAGVVPTRVPQLGLDDQDHSALSPTVDEQMIPPGEPIGIPAGPGGTLTPDAVSQVPGAPGGRGAPGGNVIPLTRNKMLDRQRPPESDEQRRTMPKPAALRDGEEPIRREAVQAREGVLANDLDEGDLDDNGALLDEQGQPIYSTLIQGPRHVGRRFDLGADGAVTAETVLGTEPEAEDAG